MKASSLDGSNENRLERVKDPLGAVSHFEAVGSDYLFVPLLEDAVESGHGLFQEVLVFFVEVARLAGEASSGVGDLIAGTEHLREKAFKDGARGGGTEHGQLLSCRSDLVVTRGQDLLPVRLLLRPSGS